MYRLERQLPHNQKYWNSSKVRSVSLFRRVGVGVKSQQMRVEGSGEGLTDVNEGQVVSWDVREVIYSKTVTLEPQEAVFL